MAPMAFPLGELAVFMGTPLVPENDDAPTGPPVIWQANSSLDWNAGDALGEYPLLQGMAWDGRMPSPLGIKQSVATEFSRAPPCVSPSAIQYPLPAQQAQYLLLRELQQAGWRSPSVLSSSTASTPPETQIGDAFPFVENTAFDGFASSLASPFNSPVELHRAEFHALNSFSTPASGLPPTVDTPTTKQRKTKAPSGSGKAGSRATKRLCPLHRKEGNADKVESTSKSTVDTCKGCKLACAANALIIYVSGRRRTYEKATAKARKEGKRPLKSRKKGEAEEVKREKERNLGPYLVNGPKRMAKLKEFLDPKQYDKLLKSLDTLAKRGEEIPDKWII